MVTSWNTLMHDGKVWSSFMFQQMIILGVSLLSTSESLSTWFLHSWTVCVREKDTEREGERRGQNSMRGYVCMGVGGSVCLCEIGRAHV